MPEGPPSSPSAWTTPDAAPVPDARPEDLEDHWVDAIFERTPLDERRAVPGEGSGEDQDLASVGLLALDGHTWRPTVAAMVLAGVRPGLFLPGCAIVGEIDGEPLALEGPFHALTRGLARRLRRRQGSGVVQEAVRNAILHRIWSSDEPVTLHLAHDHLEVTHPGVLRRSPPNPLLLSLVTMSGGAHGQERGLPAIADALRLRGLRPFSLVGRAGRVRFICEIAPPPPRSRRPRARAGGPWPAAPVPAPAPAEQARDERVGAPPALLPRDPEERANAVLFAIQRHGRATTRQVAEALGCSRPVAGKVLTTLVADGRVAKVSASPRSPFQVYELPTR